MMRECSRCGEIVRCGPCLECGVADREDLAEEVACEIAAESEELRSQDPCELRREVLEIAYEIWPEDAPPLGEPSVVREAEQTRLLEAVRKAWPDYFEEDPGGGRHCERCARDLGPDYKGCVCKHRSKPCA